MSEARHFEFGEQIDSDDYLRTHHPSMRMCSWSRDLFKFWKITDNISETVQDGEVFTTVE